MKYFIAFFIMTIYSNATYSQNINNMGPLNGDIDHPNDDRLIEPTSPILGKNLVALIKADKRHPEIILKDLKDKFPNLNRELQLSSIAYFKTLTEPLKKYCNTEIKEEPNDKAIEVVETGAIPVKVLIPLHEQYILNLSTLRKNYVENSLFNTEELAMKAANEYQLNRYNCNVVIKLNQMEAKIEKYLPKRLDNLIELHHIISSPEAAFPRIQFSVNGFTQHVFGEIFKMPYDRLVGLLKVIFDAQTEWIAKRDKNQTVERYITDFENKALSAGYLPREIILVLAYSTRNMPSIDVQYGYDTNKALLLETYFWKLHEHRDYVTKLYLNDIFPNAIMKVNPGIYHYATSALLACEVRLSGYSGIMARLVALGNKIGYKVHKLIGELASKEGKKGIKEILATAKRQGFGPGVDAGRYGGSHGLKFCRKNTPKEFWLNNDTVASPANTSDENSNSLNAEDFNPELEEVL